LPKRSATDRLADFLEIYGCFDEATAREEAQRCIQCPEPRCVSMCPLGNRIPEWLLLTAEGHFLEAATLSSATSNMPEICARVCPQDRLCEGACILGDKTEPVAIGAIEKFLNDYAVKHSPDEARPSPRNGHRVAIVGSGPGGLSCADELERRGYAVTVFESQTVPGGLLVNGIPAFKLEKSVVQRRIDLLRRRGVEFALGVTIGQDLPLRELLGRFDAVFLAFGAPKSRELDIPGAHLGGVLPALPFIIQHNTDIPLDIPPISVAGKRVVVLGGGDTAMDCLRTALRAGAREAVCLYRRDLTNMPGSRREYQNALEEGAKFVFQVAPVKVLGNADGWVNAVRCVRMEPAPRGSGGVRPRPVPGSDFVEAADLILVAFGFEPMTFEHTNDLSELAKDATGAVIVNDHMMTNLPRVFAGGDLVRGPSLVVQSVRDARRAAAEIHAYLSLRRFREDCSDQTDHVSSE
jgi:glutamate synthase (NADPH/NADH) small chain